VPKGDLASVLGPAGDLFRDKSPANSISAARRTAPV
jgi:hypothetical protein